MKIHVGLILFGLVCCAFFIDETLGASERIGIASKNPTARKKTSRTKISSSSSSSSITSTATTHDDHHVYNPPCEVFHGLHWESGQCVPCNKTHDFIFSATKKCIICPPNEGFSKKTLKCVKCLAEDNNIILKGECFHSNTMHAVSFSTSSQLEVHLPLAIVPVADQPTCDPFHGFDSALGECVPCDFQQHYLILATNSCIICPQDYGYDERTGACVFCLNYFQESFMGVCADPQETYGLSQRVPSVSPPPPPPPPPPTEPEIDESTGGSLAASIGGVIVWIVGVLACVYCYQQRRKDKRAASEAFKQPDNIPPQQQQYYQQQPVVLYYPYATQSSGGLNQDMVDRQRFIDYQNQQRSSPQPTPAPRYGKPLPPPP